MKICKKDKQIPGFTIIIYWKIYLLCHFRWNRLNHSLKIEKKIMWCRGQQDAGANYCAVDKDIRFGKLNQY